ncbi:hypothetical protein ZWY2020_041108 [Hordeum vulgare]|nr:hypothetical protein ZWY2020_041108 [Hordeum vulgare]
MAYFCTLSGGGEDPSFSLPTRGDERTRALVAGRMASALEPEEGAGAGAKIVDQGHGTAVVRSSRHRALRPDAAEVVQEGRDRRARTKKQAAKEEGRARYGCAFEEEEGMLAPHRLVWSKVKGHPWWPAQVFDAADASPLALAERRKDGAVLVANFWQKTFAWVSGPAASLRPFRDGFLRLAAVDRAHVQLWGARATMSPFASAVDEALGEVARRVEAGLSCGCGVSKKKQVIDNDGVREGAHGAVVDAGFARDAFRGEAFVEYVSALAVAPLEGADRLELTVATAQLTAFTRWRGTRGLPVYTACHGIGVADGVMEGTPALRAARRGRTKSDVADGIMEGTPARRATKRGRPKGDVADGIMEGTPARRAAKRGRPKGKRKMSRDCTCDASASESAENPLELENYEPARPRPVSHQTTTKMGRLMSLAARRMSLSPVTRRLADPQANAGVTMTRCTSAAAADHTNAAPSVNLKNCGLNKDDEPSLTGLALNFTGPDTVPPASDLVKIFSKFGPVVEARPEGSTVSVVIFERKLDAEAAFSRAEKIRALSPNLVSYRLAHSLSARPPADFPQSPMNTDEMNHLFVDVDDEALH